MEIGFTAENFKAIMRSCTSSVAKKDLSRPMLNYICLDFSNGFCTAVGCDGFKMMKVIVPCDMDGVSDCRVPIHPVKMPPQITRVVLVTSETQNEIKFYQFGQVVQTIVEKATNEHYIDYERIFPKPEERETYHISVNPKYLIDVLKGMSDSETVTLRFGNSLQSILVTVPEYFGIQKAALVLPKRTAD